MKILYFSPIPYHALKQRPQYLAEELAKEHDVIYFEPTVSMVKALVRRECDARPSEYAVSEHLRVVRLDGRRSLNRCLEAYFPFVALPERRQLQTYFREADAVWLGQCAWYDVVRGFSGKLIYDKMDEDAQLTGNPLMAKLAKKLEPELIARADLLFVTAEQFAEQMTAHGKHAVLLPNAADFSQTEQCAPAKVWQEQRVFGYVGTIGRWFDWEAIRTVLDADARNRVVLVGPAEVNIPAWERLEHVGRVPKEDVDSWIAAFDVCLYPFVRDALLETINPVKIYEYLAGNKPVLAVDSRETRRFGDLVTRYGTQGELKSALAAPQEMPFAEEAQRLAFIADNSWSARGREIRNKLSEWR